MLVYNYVCLFKIMITLFLVNSNASTIDEYMKKAKLEKLIQTASITTSSLAPPLSSISVSSSSSSIMTIHDSIEINKLIQNEIFFSQLYLNKSLQTFVKFNFTHRLVNLLNRLETNLIKITIRNYSSNRLNIKPFFILNTNLIVNTSNETTNTNKIYCSDEYGPKNFSTFVCFKLYNLYNESNFDEDYDYKLGDYLNYLTNKSSKLNKTNNSSIDSTSNRFFLFSSLLFKMKYPGNYVICIKFINNLNPNIQFFAENMCFDWIAFKDSNINNHDQHKEYHNFHYKPLFILIMYILCASLLLPIAIGQYIMTKSNKQAKDNIKQANLEETAGNDGSINSNLNKSGGSASLLGSRESNLKNLDSKTKVNELEPLLEASTSLENEDNQPSSTNKKVLFRLNSTDSLNLVNDKNEDEIDYSEAKHILDDKPWAKGSNTTLMENTSYNSNPPITSTDSNIIKSQSIMNINENKINLTNSSSASNLNMGKLKKRSSFKSTTKLAINNIETSLKNKPNSNENLNKCNEKLDKSKSSSQKIIHTIISDQKILQIELVSPNTKTKNLKSSDKNKASTGGPIFESNV